MIKLNSDVFYNFDKHLPGFFFRCLNDIDWTLLFISEKCEAILGFNSSDFLDRKISFESLIHRADTENITLKVNEALEKKEEFAFEYRIICKEGKVKWVHGIGNGIFDKKGDLKYIEGYVRDITLDKENANFENTLNAYILALNKSSIVSITDKKGVIIYANKLFCDYSKYELSEIIGSTHKLINSGFHEVDFFKNLWTQILAGEIWRGEIKNKAKDGTYYWVDSVISPILDPIGNIVQFLSIRNLITEKKEVEEQLLKKNDEIKKTVLELIKNLNDMRQFNYIVSHNLRSPVANIKGLLEIKKMTSQNDTLEDSFILQNIEISADKIDQMLIDLNMILSVKKATNKSKEEIMIDGLLKSIFSTFSLEIKQINPIINIDIKENANIIFTIKSYLESILFNLILNAFKYRSKDRIFELQIIVENIGKRLVFSIIDNGIGIDLLRYKDDVFGLYKRFNNDTEGKGLGLYMCKAQIEILGGSIVLNSEPNVGTKFTIEIPCE